MTDIRGFSPEHLRVRIAYAHIYTYRGLSLGAVHWAGEIKARGCDSIELKRTLTAAEAKTLSKKDGVKCAYKAGSRSTRFLSRNSVQKEAEREWLRHFPLAVLLIAGRAACADPQQVLIGPPEMKARLNALVKRAQEIGYWDRDENAMQEIADEWDAITSQVEET